jgi:hypothetical protein
MKKSRMKKDRTERVQPKKDQPKKDQLKKDQLKKDQPKNARPRKNKDDQALREQIVYLLEGGGAHVKFADAIAGLPAELRGKKPGKFPHSAWMLLDHLRIAQRDILEFSRNPKHTSPSWPSGYWPKTAAPPNARAWNKCVHEFNQDLKAMQNLVSNPASNRKTDLFAKFPWGEGQTLLREALLLADHNAYHVAQLIDVRRLLGAWKD